MHFEIFKYLCLDNVEFQIFKPLQQTNQGILSYPSWPWRILYFLVLFVHSKNEARLLYYSFSNTFCNKDSFPISCSKTKHLKKLLPLVVIDFLCCLSPIRSYLIDKWKVSPNFESWCNYILTFHYTWADGILVNCASFFPDCFLCLTIWFFGIVWVLLEQPFLLVSIFECFYWGMSKIS